MLNFLAAMLYGKWLHPEIALDLLTLLLGFGLKSLKHDDASDSFPRDFVNDKLLPCRNTSAGST